MYTGRIRKEYSALQEPLYQLFEITVRTSTAAWQQMLVSDIQVQVFTTSLDRPAEVIIKLYRDHATSEHYHSELKSDMGL